MASQKNSEARNPYASSSRWRHQESTAYSQYAGAHHQEARPPTNEGNTAGLADFLNKDRVEPDGPPPAHGNAQDITAAATNARNGVPAHDGTVESSAAAVDGKEVACGPLLNYRHTKHGRWYGSVLVVMKGGGQDVLYQPSLVLRRVGLSKYASKGVNGSHDSHDTNGVINGTASGSHESHDTDGVAHDMTNGSHDSHGTNGVINGTANGATEGVRYEPQRLYSDRRNTFWSFDINVEIEPTEVEYEYTVPEVRYASPSKPRTNNFFIHAANESMRLMFHSCNGFSVGTDEEAWSGAALWNDVNRKHAAKPFHVMIGGGDQIYNDGIRVHGPLRAWADVGNPRKRQDYKFPETLRAACDDYYLNNYIRWYNTEPFASANGRIPQLNIWDDHDIIDGFGSYVDRFMRCDVFRGIGGTAHKYYMLFQHHLPPPPSTYCSDHKANDGSADPNQLIDTFVAPAQTYDQYIVGKKPGPYVAEHSYNMYTRLGARMALMGLDARTERTRHQINYPETYTLVFDRLRKELGEAASSPQPIKHLIILLGIPIAYPRLTWLENILRSPLIGPVKFMHKRFGVGGGLFNQFDGSVDLLDDLDDHYTARQHKEERAQLIENLQDIAAEFSVRVTILGGDVHLAALGRFYSNPKLGIPAEEDSRYMANVVSSAIVNKPPPQAVANLLARRNKIHHLNHRTDETLLDLFNKDPGDNSKTAGFNHCTMPSRNFAMLTENSPNNHRIEAPQMTNGHDASNGVHDFKGKDGHNPLHPGEVEAGTQHKAATDEGHGRSHDGSLDIRINVEIDQHSSEGRTEAYGLSVPLLTYKKPATAHSHRHHHEGQAASA